MIKQMLTTMSCCTIAATALYADTIHWTGTTDADFWKLSNWTHYEWTGSENHFWGIEDIGEVLSGDISLNDYYNWKYPNNSGYVVDLGGRTATLGGKIDVLTKAEHPIVLCNGVVDMAASGQPFRVNPTESQRASLLVISNMTLNVAKLYVGGNVYSGKGTGIVHQVKSTVVADRIELSRCNYSYGEYVIESGSATFGKFCFGGDNWDEPSTNALVRLDGGVLTVPLFEKQCKGCENPKIVFNGGVLKVSADNSDLIPNWLTATVGEGGLCIDTDGHDVSISAGRISAYDDAAALVKSGAGTLKLGDARTWAGPVSVLGGTLDLNGGTITGPLVLAGDGKIVNATVSTTDITIMEGYELAPQLYSEFEDGAYSISALKVGPGASVVAPVKGLLSSAVGWYDPSDATTVLYDENGGVTNLLNKGVAGASCDMILKEATSESPYISQVNGLDAIVFTNNYGFEATSRVNMNLAKGRSVFAVARCGDTGDKKITAIEWSRGEWTWDHGQHLRLAVESGRTYANFMYLNDSDEDKDMWLGADNMALSASAYVNSARDLPDAEGTNVWVRVTGYSGGNIIDNTNTTVQKLKTGEERYRISYGWSKGGDSRSNGIAGEALAYDRWLADGEADLIHAYLGHKWVSSEIPAPVAKLNIGSLTLAGGTVGFEGSDITVGDLVGNGAMSDAAKVTVTGTITAKLVSDGAAIAVSASLDLTGTTLVLDESAFALSQIGDMATVFSASSISGVPEIQLESEDKRKIKVRNMGTAITVMRMNPGFTLIVR
ncbi:MAG: hypothetical protein II840_00120 [Kiritimatiellae bacterium]|nr:hypothetical protein [Kiritimatiellia bacterium]